MHVGRVDTVNLSVFLEITRFGLLQIEIGSAACSGLWHGSYPPPVLAPFAVATGISQWKATRIASESRLLYAYEG